MDIMEDFISQNKLLKADYDEYFVNISLAWFKIVVKGYIGDRVDRWDRLKYTEEYDGVPPFVPDLFFRELEESYLRMFDKHICNCIDSCPVKEERLENCPKIVNEGIYCDECEDKGCWGTATNCDECTYEIHDSCMIPHEFDGYFKIGDIEGEDYDNITFFITSTKLTFDKVLESLKKNGLQIVCNGRFDKFEIPSTSDEHKKIMKILEESEGTDFFESIYSTAVIKNYGVRKK
jgi:hypothetical protein